MRGDIRCVAMQNFLNSLFVVLILGVVNQLSAQGLDQLSFGKEETFEVVTWNIEWFPKNGQTTVDSVRRIIEALDVDVLAIQELDDTTHFNALVDSLDGYEGYFNRSWLDGLAYIYKTNTINVSALYVIFDTQPYWSIFPRSPLVMELSYGNEDMVIINNHFKCCGDGILNLSHTGDEETRRYNANNLLKSYADTALSHSSVIILGDLNDLLTDIPAHNVFQSFIDDSSNYSFVDQGIAQGSIANWSYPNWPSHLDHILISDELFDVFSHDSSAVETIRIGDYMSGGFNTYDQYISDHRPVGLRLSFDSIATIGAEEYQAYGADISIFPNPARESIEIRCNTMSNHANIQLYNAFGAVVKNEWLQAGQTSLKIDVSNYSSGLYYMILRIDGQIIGTERLLIENGS